LIHGKTIYFLVLFFFLHLFQGYGQSYKVVFYDQCKKEYTDFPTCFYQLKDEQGKLYSIDIKNTEKDFFIKLPHLGEYTVDWGCLGDEDNSLFKVEIKDTKLYIDTISLQSLYIARHISNPPLVEYMCCDSVCDGKFADYYYNGTIWKTGTFKKGQAIDTLKEYYENGKLKRVYVPFLKWWKKYDYTHKRPKFLLLEYHKKGYLEMKTDSRISRETIFYANGKIKSDHWYKKDKYTEYDTNGVKSAIILFDKEEDWGWDGSYIKEGYYANGKIKYKYKKQYKDKDGVSYNYQEFGMNGDLIRECYFFIEKEKYKLGTDNFPNNITDVPQENMKEDILYVSPKEKIVRSYTFNTENGIRVLCKTFTRKMKLSENKWITKYGNVEYYNSCK